MPRHQTNPTELRPGQRKSAFKKALTCPATGATLDKEKFFTDQKEIELSRGEGDRAYIIAVRYPDDTSEIHMFSADGTHTDSKAYRLITRIEDGERIEFLSGSFEPTTNGDTVIPALKDKHRMLESV